MKTKQTMLVTSIIIGLLLMAIGYVSAVIVSGNWTVDITPGQAQYAQNWLQEHNMTKDELASNILQNKISTLEQQDDSARWSEIKTEWEVFRSGEPTPEEEQYLLNCLRTVNG